MSDAKDPAIKLFGRTIQLAPNDDVSGDADCEQSCCDHSNSNNNNNNCLSCSNGSVSPSCLFDKSSTAGEGSTDSKLEDGSSSAGLEEQTAGEDKQSSSLKASKKDEESEKSSKSQDKPLKKPDKILPCPRCNSTDTKFCYFNNYNVNQPRYFCKNCQRYWTAGGTMRNVPVGAGRRKNKHSSSNPRYIVIPDTPNGMIYPALRGNAFGSEAPLCESMTSSLTIAESSSNTSSNPTGQGGGNPVTQEPSTSGIQSFGPQVPCYPAPPWPSPWNPAQWSSPVPPYPFPVPIFATPPYWNCGVPAAWSTPWMHPADVSSPSLSPNSPLGKHPREGGTPKSSNKEQHGEEHGAETKVLTPKILRIDDPSEAAKSSIWTTLGIKHGNTSSLNSGVFFRGLQAKGGPICSAPEASSVLQANPAALSRSLTYHETAE